RLRSRPDLYKTIYLPGQGAYFERHGLLYLDSDALWRLDERLAEGQAFLGILSHDPSLNGLFSVLGHAVDQPLGAESAAMLRAMFDRISTTLEAQLAGHPKALSWRDELLGDNDRPQRGFILVQPKLDRTSLEAAGEALSFIRALAQSEDIGRGGVRVRLTGPVAMDEEELVNVSEDSAKATLLSFALVCVILFLGLGSPFVVLAILATLVIGLVWTAAFAILAFGHLNLISVSFAVLFIGLGVDFGIQFGMRYREELTPDKSKERALKETALGVGTALGLAAATAAISFLAFAPTRYRGLAELGVISGFGMLAALVANLTVLPALLRLLPTDSKKSFVAGRPADLLNLAVTRYRRAVLIGSLLIAMGCVALFPALRFDFNPLNLKDPTTDAVMTFRDLLNDPDTTPYIISVLAPHLEQAQALAAKIEQLEVVDKAVTLASYVPEHQDEKLEIINDMSLMVQPMLLAQPPPSPPDLSRELEAIEAFCGKLQHLKTPTDAAEYSSAVLRLVRVLLAFESAARGSNDKLADLRGNLIGDLPRALKSLKTALSAQRVTLESLPQDLK
ncbi:MAG: MMPL family transporter, partial [Burkholderiales bacterium]